MYTTSTSRLCRRSWSKILPRLEWPGRHLRHANMAASLCHCRAKHLVLHAHRPRQRRQTRKLDQLLSLCSRRLRQTRKGLRRRRISPRRSPSSLTWARSSTRTWARWRKEQTCMLSTTPLQASRPLLRALRGQSRRAELRLQKGTGKACGSCRHVSKSVASSNADSLPLFSSSSCVPPLKGSLPRHKTALATSATSELIRSSVPPFSPYPGFALAHPRP